MKQETKQALYGIVKRIDDKLRYEHDVLNLISSLWNVYQKPSTSEDSRYKILGDEIDKHYFMNDDWTQDKLYLSVLHILDDEHKLLRFVEGLINIMSDEAIINDLQKILETENYQIINDEGRLVIQTIGECITPEVDNRIPFIRCKSVITNYFRFEEKEMEVPDEKEEDFDSLKDFIERNINDFLIKSNSYSTYMRKLICFYDWKKYGWE